MTVLSENVLTKNLCVRLFCVCPTVRIFGVLVPSGLFKISFPHAFSMNRTFTARPIAFESSGSEESAPDIRTVIQQIGASEKDRLRHVIEDLDERYSPPLSIRTNVQTRLYPEVAQRLSPQYKSANLPDSRPLSAKVDRLYSDWCELKSSPLRSSRSRRSSHSTPIARRLFAPEASSSQSRSRLRASSITALTASEAAVADEQAAVTEGQAATEMLSQASRLLELSQRQENELQTSQELQRVATDLQTRVFLESQVCATSLLCG